MSEEKYVRPTWDEYFMEVARTIAKRATCDRGRSGCVIARDNQILVTGYVGSPAGLPHCDDVGHLFRKSVHEDGSITNHCVRTVHAEQNAICQAAKRGISIDGGTVYCKMTPCRSITTTRKTRCACSKRPASKSSTWKTACRPIAICSRSCCHKQYQNRCFERFHRVLRRCPDAAF